MAVHKECKNYSKNWCNLKEKEVDPDGPACEDFETKEEKGKSGINKSEVVNI